MSTEKQMPIFDIHSHWGTERGYVLRSTEALEQQKHTWNSTPRYDTEEEMARYFRANRVRAILDFGFTKNLPLSDLKPLGNIDMQLEAWGCTVVVFQAR